MHVPVFRTTDSFPGGGLLRADQLCVRYPGARRAALDRVGLSVSSGEFIAVLGPSGSGKSTLLRCLNRLVTPSSGIVEFDGRDVTRASGAALRRLRRDVGMIFQQFNLVERRTVLQNVLSGRFGHLGFPFARPLSWAGVFPAAHREIAVRCLKQVGLEQYAHRRVDRLSGGQRQRVAIARLLAQEPKVILADEPIANLDPKSAAVVMHTLRAIRDERGIPVVVNLHQVEVARSAATRIVALRAGVVCFDGAPSLFDDDAAHAIYGMESSSALSHSNAAFDAQPLIDPAVDRVDDRDLQELRPTMQSA